MTGPRLLAAVLLVLVVLAVLRIVQVSRRVHRGQW